VLSVAEALEVRLIGMTEIEDCKEAGVNEDEFIDRAVDAIMSFLESDGSFTRDLEVARGRVKAIIEACYDLESTAHCRICLSHRFVGGSGVGGGWNSITIEGVKKRICRSCYKLVRNGEDWDEGCCDDDCTRCATWNAYLEHRTTMVAADTMAARLVSMGEVDACTAEGMDDIDVIYDRAVDAAVDHLLIDCVMKPEDIRKKVEKIVEKSIDLDSIFHCRVCLSHTSSNWRKVIFAGLKKRICNSCYLQRGLGVVLEELDEACTTPDCLKCVF
jgi:hypothetical protein